jgi:superfamily II DNA or RNA helicase
VAQQQRRSAIRLRPTEAGVMTVSDGAVDVPAVDDSSAEPIEPAEFAADVSAAPHQAAAVEAAVEALATGGEALVVMATGTGKTLVGLWTAEMIGASRIAVLVPSLTLADQTSAVWARHGAGGVEVLTVCSDTVHESTTDAAQVAEFLAGAGTKVVVGTYHSAAVLAEASRRHRLDLVIADEAHHCIPVRRRNGSYAIPHGPFGALARREISTDRTLLMTATPRQLPVAGAGTGDSDGTSLCAPVVYNLGLGQAIDSGLLASYRVVLAAVDRDEVEQVRLAMPDGVEPELLAGAVAVTRTMAEFGLRRCLSFHSRVGRARRFAALVAAAGRHLPATSRPTGSGWSAWLHGSTSKRDRKAVLDRLADTDTTSWGVVANVRCLGEGVDVPALDAVAICDPKSSPVDVAQAVGRALRCAPGKGEAVIILPIVVDGDGDAAVPSVHSMQLASKVLRSLRTHDEQLADRLDAVSRSGAGSPARMLAWREQLSETIDIRLPPGAASELADRISLTVIESSSTTWDGWFTLLEQRVATVGTAAVPQDEVFADGDDNGWDLGGWCTSQRTLRRRGLLEPGREAALEALPGWQWEPRDARWWAKYDALKAWAGEHGTASCPLTTVDRHGVKIGQFVNVVRTTYGAGGVDAERVAALEALPRWTWDVLTDRWEEKFALLCRWVSDNATARPSHGDVVEGTDLGRWVSKQRIKVRAGTLEPSQAARLRELPGWVDHERDVPWAENLELLRGFAAANGRMPVQTEKAGDGVALGSWVAKQRSRYQAGQMAQERAEALQSVPGWTWSPRRERDAFSAAVARLGQYVDDHGTARVPDGWLAADGFMLGKWVGNQRRAYRAGTLTPQRIDVLESFDGWSWAPDDDAFDAKVAVLDTFLRTHGRMPRTVEVVDGERLGVWVRALQRKYAAGKVIPQRVAAVEALDGWSWGTAHPG